MIDLIRKFINAVIEISITLKSINKRLENDAKKRASSENKIERLAVLNAIREANKRLDKYGLRMYHNGNVILRKKSGENIAIFDENGLSGSKVIQFGGSSDIEERIYLVCEIIEGEEWLTENH